VFRNLVFSAMSTNYRVTGSGFRGHVNRWAVRCFRQCGRPTPYYPPEKDESGVPIVHPIYITKISMIIFGRNFGNFPDFFWHFHAGQNCDEPDVESKLISKDVFSIGVAARQCFERRRYPGNLALFATFSLFKKLSWQLRSLLASSVYGAESIFSKWGLPCPSGGGVPPFNAYCFRACGRIDAKQINCRKKKIQGLRRALRSTTSCHRTDIAKLETAMCCGSARICERDNSSHFVLIRACLAPRMMAH
jgi:hypothetical protein